MSKYWSKRERRCTGCGYSSRHYMAHYDKELHLFAVPSPDANGGIVEELDADGWEPLSRGMVRKGDVWLSKCCDAPAVPQRRRS